MSIVTNASVARKYREQYGMEMPTHTLAAIMFKDDPMRFTSKEKARSALRYIEGKNGKTNREKVINSPFARNFERSVTPYNLPAPESEDLVPYELGWDRFVLAGDFHIPNHRIQPIETMLDYSVKHGIKKLFINGDLLDNTPFTRWLREPIKGDEVKRWFDQARDFLTEMKRIYDEVIWLEGNHDFWYHRWLMQSAPLLFGDNYYHLEKRLGLEEIGVKFLDQTNLVRAGRLFISHGHIIRAGGVHAAARLVNKSGASHIVSHLHREQSFTKTDIDGKIHTGYVTGCMCTLSPEYQRYGSDACHGFADISVYENRDFNVRNYRIYNGIIQNGEN